MLSLVVHKLYDCIVRIADKYNLFQDRPALAVKFLSFSMLLHAPSHPTKNSKNYLILKNDKAKLSLDHTRTYIS